MRLLNWSFGWTEAEINGANKVVNPNDPQWSKMDNITPEQETALKEFRHRIGHRLPLHLSSDTELLRWLTARNFDVNQAEQMLLKNIEWRKEWQVDTILDWQPPEALINYYTVGYSGVDKDGAPVWIVAFGNCDVRGLLHSVHARDYLRYTIYMFEKSLELMKELSKGRETPLTKQTGIFDLENFSLKQMTFKPAIDVILQIIQFYEANYPEVLKCAYVINAPKMFTTLYALIKPFLHEVTISKIQIFGRNGWKEPVLKQIYPDQLPEHWGGTMRDPDGNPKCPSKICLGGEVPKSYYFKSKRLEPQELESSHLKRLILPKTGRKFIELEVEQPMSVIRWEFRSDDFDVGFGIYRVLKTGEEETVMQPQRVNSHLVPEEGSLVCDECGIYKFLFDNEFSYLRSKKLYYNIEVRPPANINSS